MDTTTQEVTTMSTTTECIANSDTSKGPEVPLWDCPCRECWRLEQDITDPEGQVTYAEWKDERGRKFR